MKAALTTSNVWVIADGKDAVMLHLTDLGLVVQRISSSNGKNIRHADQLLPYDKIIAKAEGQALLPL